MVDQDPQIRWEFTGNERYRLVRRLGEGGMGVVYEVFDNQRQEHIALKTLHRVSAAAIYRFKREFRTLANVSHTNLVTLHELVSQGDGLFFTMELIEGTEFLKYVRPVNPSSVQEAPTIALDTERETLLEEGETLVEMDVPGPPPIVEERLRDGLRQLAQGLVALHDAGKLHRDVKPSNVLLTPEGRVVLLDFGLSADLDEDSLIKSQLGMVIGTVAYMAPEQAVGEFTKASDWYSVGVMLFQALTSQLPFSGSMFKVVLQKQESEAPDPEILVPGMPKDLAALCRDLLRRDPNERPIGRDVLRRLGGYLPSRATPALAWSAPDLAPRFMGRRGHLDALGRAFARAEAGSCTVVHVHGAAGIGKSALVRRFVERLPKDEAHVLVGRCYEHEVVPYKAFDSIVDALSRRLSHRSHDELQDILPDDIEALAQVFPVLNRVEAIQLRSAQLSTMVDAIELRRRAFAALRALLFNLSQERPIILFIDDLQWGDADSTILLRALLASPVPRRLMLVAAYRAEDRDTSELLTTLRTPTPGVELREIIVGPLDQASALALSQAVLGRGPEADATSGTESASLRTTIPSAAPMHLRAQAEKIATESRGNPIFIFELASHARNEGEAPGDLDQVLARRFLSLNPETLRLLEVLAVSSHPLLRTVANRAAEIARYDHTPANTLVTGHLARSRVSEAGDELETYHGRIRDAVLTGMDPETKRKLHLTLVDALQAESADNPWQVVYHLEQAGEAERASTAALNLARRSADTLGLETAASLSRLALDLTTEDHKQFDLRREHAEALETASNKEASEAYLAAANCAERRNDELEMRRRAAEQFLRFGEIDRGLEVLQGVLRAWGMSLPADAAQGLAELRVHRARLLARGLAFDETATRDPNKLRQADACFTAAVGLTMVDTVTASIFITRYLHLALDCGDPNRVARALAMELAYLASAGKKRPSRTQRVLLTLRALAERIDAPYVRGFAALGAGLAAWHEGAWDQSEQASKNAARVLAARCKGVEWELNTARTFRLWSCALCGNFKGLEPQLQLLLHNAVEQGDLYGATIARTNTNAQYVLLAADQPELARTWLDEGEAEASHARYNLKRYWALSSRVQLTLYNQDGPTAWTLLTEGWRNLAQAGIFRVQVIRWEAIYLRARVALAAAVSSSAHRPLVATARADGERLRNSDCEYAEAWGLLILAQANRALGLQSEANDLFAAATLRCQETHMQTHADVAQLRMAQIMGPSAGRPLAMQVLARLKQRGVVRPNRIAFLLSPDKT